jgi:sugar phosphate isomerase/epimerase
MKKSALVLCFAVALAGAITSCSQKPKPLFDHPIGVQAYTYRASFPKNVVQVLDTIKSLGITEIEGFDLKGVSPDTLKKLLQERNITMPSLGADYDSLAANQQPTIKTAKFYGCKYVMVSWIPHDSTFNLNDAKKAVEDFNRAGKVLQENGLTLCYHTHGYEFGKYGDGTLFDYIAQNTDPKYVSFELDMLWAFHGGGDPAKLLYKYKDRFKLVHLKDIRKGIANDLTGATDIKNDVALGTGQLNIPEILKAAKAVGIQHYFIEDESPNHATQIPVTIAYLKSLQEKK